MAHMIHKNTNIKNKKVKLSLKVLIFLILMITSFVIGRFILQKYTNLFSIIAIIFAFICSMFAVKLIILIPYKDSKQTIFKEIKKLPNKFYAINGVLLTSDLYKAYFEHIIIGHRKLYFITFENLDDKKIYKYNQVIDKILNQINLNYKHKLVIGETQFYDLISKINTQDSNVTTKGQKKIIQIIKNYSM